MPSSYVPAPPETSDTAPEGQIWLCPNCSIRGASRRALGKCAATSVLVYEASLMLEEGVLISAEAVNDPIAEIVW